MTDTEELDSLICPHSGFCGGCVHQGVPYEEQLKIKEQEVIAALQEYSVHPKELAPIEGCGSGERYRYRNKMEYTFGDEVKDGPLCLGLHRPGQFMSITTVDQCQLVPEDFNRILRYTLDFCIAKAYSKYHKRRHDGLLRNLVLRRGVRTGEILVNIVTQSEAVCGECFDAEEWAEGLKQLALEGRVCGILHTLNDNKADTVNCDSSVVLYGNDSYTDVISGLSFKVHEYSFFQTNVTAAERMYTEAAELIRSRGEVFDLYCGTGTISQILAKKCEHVTGVELVRESIDMARENAAENGLGNCSFVCGDVFDVLDHADEHGICEKPDAIVVDPPRVGMTPDAVRKIASYGVPEIVYVSCNPKSLARNLSEFRNYGYGAAYLKPYDNFPMTSHVETVALLRREKQPGISRQIR